MLLGASSFSSDVVLLSFSKLLPGDDGSSNKTSDIIRVNLPLFPKSNSTRLQKKLERGVSMGKFNNLSLGVAFTAALGIFASPALAQDRRDILRDRNFGAKSATKMPINKYSLAQ